MRFPEFSGEWEKYRLKDIANISKERIGINMLSNNNYISTENMKPDFGGVDVAINFPASGNVIKFQKGDTLLSNIRPYLKKIWQAKFDGGCSADIFVFRSNILCNSDFLYYTLANEKFILYAMSGAKGVKMPRGDKEQILKYDLHLPTTIEQNKIASMLSLLDDRIATQIKIIEKLESLIKGLYERLFNIDGAAYIQLGNVAKIQKGQQINGEELSEIGSYYVMNGGVVPSGYLEDFNTPANTISISEGGNSCGYVQYNGVPFWSGGHCYTLIEPINSFNYKYLFHYLKFKEQSIMALRIGSGLPNIQKKDLERFPILNVSKEEQDKMACIFDDILDRIICERQIALKYEE